MYLVELALALARLLLKPGGAFMAKVFQGEGFDLYLKALRMSFKTVVTRSRMPVAVVPVQSIWLSRDFLVKLSRVDRRFGVSLMA